MSATCFGCGAKTTGIGMVPCRSCYGKIFGGEPLGPHSKPKFSSKCPICKKGHNNGCGEVPCSDRCEAVIFGDNPRMKLTGPDRKSLKYEKGNELDLGQMFDSVMSQLKEHKNTDDIFTVGTKKPKGVTKTRVKSTRKKAPKKQEIKYQNPIGLDDESVAQLDSDQEYTH